MKKAFSLIELMIGVAIIGILAAIVLPLFQSNMTEAKEAAAKDNLRILRNTIEFYAAQHGGVPPGYPGNNPNTTPVSVTFKAHLTVGGYLRKIPTNPFNDLSTVRTLSNATNFPAGATGAYGWIYKPSLKAIRLDWPGTDSKGTPYYDY